MMKQTWAAKTGKWDQRFETEGKEDREKENKRSSPDLLL